MAQTTKTPNPTKSGLDVLESFAARLGRTDPAAPAAAVARRKARKVPLGEVLEVSRLICAGAARGRMTLARGEVVQCAMELADELDCRDVAIYLVPGLLGMGKTPAPEEFLLQHGEQGALLSHLCAVGGVFRRLGGGVPQTLEGFYHDGLRVAGILEHPGQRGHWI